MDDLTLSDDELNDELIKQMKQKIENFDKVYERMKPFIKNIREEMKKKAAENVNVFYNSETLLSFDNFSEKIDQLKDQCPGCDFKKEWSEDLLFFKWVTYYFYNYYLILFSHFK